MNTNPKPIIMAIDTSFDETSVAVCSGNIILSNIVSSKVELYKEFGGVVPSIARLEHIKKIDKIIELALEEARVTFENIDFFAVTIGPGLAIALGVGIDKAKELARRYNKPLITVNHMEGHLLSAFAETNSQFPIPNSQLGDTDHEPRTSHLTPGTPSIGFLISGGNTQLILVKNFNSYQKIGETIDDACGEAYDKCARLLNLSYPGGKSLSELAEKGRQNGVFAKEFKGSKGRFVQIKFEDINLELPIPMLNSGDLNFSFSGIKTAFKYLVQKLEKENLLNDAMIKALAVLFEESTSLQLAYKLESAIKQYQPKEIWIGGGVISNNYIKEKIASLAAKYNLTFRYPKEFDLRTDNAAMIGVAAYVKQLRFKDYNDIKNVPQEDLAAYDIYTSNLEKIDREPALSID